MNRIRIIGIFILTLAVIAPEAALADWKIYYTGVIGQQSGYHGRGSFATQPQCQQYRMTMPGGSMSYCGGFDTPTQSSSSGDDGTAALEQEKQRQLQLQREQEERELELARQKKFAEEKEKLRTGLKGGTSTGGTGLKTGTTALPLKGSGNSQSIGLKTYDAAAKEKTIKAIKELNCSAYWGLNSAKAALDGKNEVTKNLDDKYTLARKYGEYSAMAKDGKTVSGCPEVKIIVPDVPPPVEANPQIQLYKHIIQQTEILVPDIIETQQKIKKTKQSLKNIKEASAANRNETEKIVEKLFTTKNEAEKDKLKAKYEENNIKYDELEKQAQEMLALANQLNTKADKQGETVVDLQKIYDDVQANPERAKELAGKVR